jgi:acyl-[acyl-carrier-protein]-phospholipid O-acyltransferase / long-chain-fatty-acid--[acyl-carrier-protein] ligase
VPIVEGYGVTEASPVVAINKPADNRRDTVGQLLPGLEAQPEPVEGISEGGRLHVRGPNIMAGYLGQGGRDRAARRRMVRHRRHRLDRPGRLGADPRPGQALRQDRRRDGVLDRGRGTDLRPLARWPHAVVSLSDPKKGERLVLVTDCQDAEPAALLAHFKATGAPQLAAPKRIIRVNELPALGSGKTDYVAMAEANAIAGKVKNGRRRPAD